jgi:pimeloyl-ACP methyl ester carboxylesterase
VPRELEAETAYVFNPARFASVELPTLLLVGGDSPGREMDHARGVAAALPNSRIAVMPGQQLTAMYTAPDLVVSEVVDFLSR